MKAEELMIGDWVYDKVLQSKCRVVNLAGSYSIRCDIHVKNHIVNEFDPIPITPEILEKNGFRKTSDGWECRANPLTTLVIHEKQSFDFWIADAPYEWEHLKFQLPLPQNVHNLQHILKLLGIDKQITI